MIAIINLPKDKYELLEKRRWCAMVYEKDYDVITNSDRFALIRYEGEITGYAYIDYREYDKVFPNILYVCLCEIRKYDTPVSYFVETDKDNDYTNDPLILVSNDEERIHTELDLFNNREDKSIWDAPKYLRNKERTLFKVKDSILESNAKDLTELTSLLIEVGVLRVYSIDNGGNIIYEMI